MLSSSFYVSNGDDAAALAAASISISWIIAVTQMLEDAAIQGVTFCTCSGDNGTDAREGDGQAHVSYPDRSLGSCLGGTTIGNVIAANCDEWAWADDGLTRRVRWWVSDYFPHALVPERHHYPVSVQGSGIVGRGVPDVAANASPNSGSFTVTLLGMTRVDANGTSASAPLWAGLSP